MFERNWPPLPVKRNEVLVISLSQPPPPVWFSSCSSSSFFKLYIFFIVYQRNRKRISSLLHIIPWFPSPHPTPLNERENGSSHTPTTHHSCRPSLAPLSHTKQKKKGGWSSAKKTRHCCRFSVKPRALCIFLSPLKSIFFCKTQYQKVKLSWYNGGGKRERERRQRIFFLHSATRFLGKFPCSYSLWKQRFSPSFL